MRWSKDGIHLTNTLPLGDTLREKQLHIVSYSFEIVDGCHRLILGSPHWRRETATRLGPLGDCFLTLIRILTCMLQPVGGRGRAKINICM